jgi:hypothetical protein
MLPAEALKQMSRTHQIIAQLGQGPSAIRQSQLSRGLVGNADNLPDLGGGQLRRHTQSGALSDEADPPPLKVMQVGINRIGMQLKALGNVHRAETVRVGQQDFGTLVRASLVWFLQHPEEQTHLSEAGFTDMKQARHNQSPWIEEYHSLAILTNYRRQILTSFR